MAEAKTIQAVESQIGRKLTEKELARLDVVEKYGEEARVQFIIIHRVNQYAYDTCLRVFDEMDKRGMRRFKAKVLCKRLDAIWGGYIKTIYNHTAKPVYMMLMDNFMLTTDLVRPKINSLIYAIRDYLISKGERDVVWKAEAIASIQLLKVATHSFEQFFKDFKKECGIDYTIDFEYADLHEFEATFKRLCNELKLVPDIDIFQNIRCKWAWDKMMKVIRDEDMMDDAARRAIHLNPVVEEQYQKELEAAERSQMEERLSVLSDKYKISKLK